MIEPILFYLYQMETFEDMVDNYRKVKTQQERIFSDS